MLNTVLFYKISTLVNCILPLVFAGFLFYKSANSIRNRLFAYYCLSISFWSFFYFVFLSTPNIYLADFYLRTCMIGVLFMPVLYLHFVVISFDVKGVDSYIPISYIFTAICASLVYSSFFVTPGGPFLIFKYWAKPAVIFNVALLFFFLVIVFVYQLLIKKIRQGGEVGNQAAFFLMASIIGHVSGFTNYFVWYRIPILPFANIFISFFIIVIIYAIIKYRLMDIRVAVSSVGILFAVYSLTLGVPIFLYGKAQHFWALCSMGLLATVALPIYEYWHRRTEKNILQDEFDRQDALQDAVNACSQKSSVDEVAGSLVESVMKVMGVDQVALYLFDGKGYMPKEVRGDKKYAKFISGDGKLVSLLKDREAFVVNEVIHEQVADQAMFHELPSVVVVSLCLEDHVIGIFFLGPKASNAQYSDRDIRTFRLVARSAAEAIERAYRNEKEKRSMYESLQDRHLKSVATMGAGISHQVFNRMNLMGFALQNIEDILEFSEVLGEAEKKEMLESAKTIRDHIKGATESTEGLKAASRQTAVKAEDGKKNEGAVRGNVSLKSVLDRARVMARDLRHMEYEYVFLNEEDITLYCVEAYLQESFLNIFTNGLDAIKVYQNPPPGYTPKIIASWRRDNGEVVIDVTDNGPGFSSENLEKAFTPYHTTKGVGKGTGLGLDTVRNFVRLEKGSVEILSEFGKGATVRIRLPLTQKE